MTDAPYVPPQAPHPQQAPYPQQTPYPQHAPYPQQPYAAPGPVPTGAGAPPERIGRGILLALAALPVGMILSALIWQAGFIASLSTFVMAALIPFLYRIGSGGGVRRGIPAIIGLIVLGTVLSFFAMVTSDLITAYRDFSDTERQSYGSFGQFWAGNIVYGPVLAAYGKDAAMYVLFALLGGAGTVVRLLRSARTRPVA